MTGLGNLHRLPELLELYAAQSVGVTLTPIRKGQLEGGPYRVLYNDLFRNSEYQFDGWAVGWIGGMVGDDEVAVGETLEAAIAAAIEDEKGDA